MKTGIRIGDLEIGEPKKCFVVAEAGSNHNGDLGLAKDLITSAKACGCDAVKFQAFKTENLVTPKAAKAEYQQGRSSGGSQFEMLKALEFGRDEHIQLIRCARMADIPIFYSVFDEASADLIEELGIGLFKLGSGELTNTPLIKYIAGKSKPLILSTGMGSDEEIADAVTAFREELNEQLFLMNCSIGYPSCLQDSHLRRIAYLEERFKASCGNSDHTTGILVGLLAAALGVGLIEKHFTLDKNLPGPDHSMSMDPGEMKKLCGFIRVLEKNPVTEDKLAEALGRIGVKAAQKDIEVVLGKGARELSEKEKKQRFWSRKSLVAARDIAKEEFFTDSNLAVKRPEDGILPKHYADILGARSKCSICEGTPIKWEMVECGK